MKEWLSAAGIPTLYIEPGSPRENGYAESFNSRFRSDFLDRDIFRTLQEAQVLSETRRLKHNHKRPHSSLGYQTPAHSTMTHDEEAVAALNALP